MIGRLSLHPGATVAEITLSTDNRGKEQSSAQSSTKTNWEKTEKSEAKKLPLSKRKKVLHKVIVKYVFYKYNILLVMRYSNFYVFLSTCSGLVYRNQMDRVYPVNYKRKINLVKIPKVLVGFHQTRRKIHRHMERA